MLAKNKYFFYLNNLIINYNGCNSAVNNYIDKITYQ